jgi:hypothetical protein
MLFSMNPKMSLLSLERIALGRMPFLMPMFVFPRLTCYSILLDEFIETCFTNIESAFINAKTAQGMP